MTQQKKIVKSKQLRAQLSKELNFMKNIFSHITIPQQMKGENEENTDYEIYNGAPKSDEQQVLPKRARTIAELEEKLEKIKSKSKFNLKNKLVKKSLSSKLNKKIKKGERQNKTNVKPVVDEAFDNNTADVKPKPKVSKPVFNNEGKLVFSKFDFANIGQREKPNKSEKDPKKILENLQQQEEKLRKMEETEDTDKVKEMKEKLAWKNILQKAEGQKIKDDPTLLKKSIKKMEQKKKHSKKEWDTRIQSVEQKKEDRQKKRKENISKKKKEKKTKKIKTAVKRGRVVI